MLFGWSCNAYIIIRVIMYGNEMTLVEEKRMRLLESIEMCEDVERKKVKG